MSFDEWRQQTSKPRKSEGGVTGGGDRGLASAGQRTEESRIASASSTTISSPTSDTLLGLSMMKACPTPASILSKLVNNNSGETTDSDPMTHGDEVRKKRPD